MVNPSDPSALKRVVRKYLRKNFGIFDSYDRALTAETCFEGATCDGANVIHLAPQWNIQTTGGELPERAEAGSTKRRV